MDEVEGQPKGVSRFLNIFKRKPDVDHSAVTPPSEPEEPTLEDMLVEIEKAEAAGDPRLERLERRYLMRTQEESLDEDKKKRLKEQVTLYDPAQIDVLTDGGTRRVGLKFARQGERIILFPDLDRESRESPQPLHIDFAVADGMTLPDDGGKIIIDPMAKEIFLRDKSSSLHLNPNDPAPREATIDILTKNLPEGYTLELTRQPMPIFLDSKRPNHGASSSGDKTGQ